MSRNKPAWKKIINLAVESGVVREEAMRRMVRQANGDVFFNPPLEIVMPHNKERVKVLRLVVSDVEMRRPNPRRRRRPVPKPKYIVIRDEQGCEDEIYLGDMFPSH